MFFSVYLFASLSSLQAYVLGSLILVLKSLNFNYHRKIIVNNAYKACMKKNQFGVIFLLF